MPPGDNWIFLKFHTYVSVFARPPGRLLQSQRLARLFLESSLAFLCALFPGAVGPCAASFAPPDGERIHWEPLLRAQLKLDGKVPYKWNVYAPDKKGRKKYASLVLVLLGRRYLALDIKGKLAYVVLPSDLQAQGQDFESDNLARPDRVLPSTDWTVRDVGIAELVRLTLGDYGRELEVQLPHPPDLRWAY
jgi:hypothetical protein